ncbi:MAG TPA: asparagine synthase (glutamine-hydrolyzing) [Gemmatimonadales bacterium]|jgi:asparagine synthase (glutamine-hydrolysing)
MCGLAGMIDPTLSREQGDALLRRMQRTIQHRGPDNSGRWIDGPVFLGHNRLSIIALTDDANQPMESGDLVIVYNGEVYNYLELREELSREGHRFRTQSDTEVVLVAYRAWGPDCVKRFVGMWAFAIWDRAKRELFCSRDRFGIKPFYYIHQGDRFYFGSEYKPLKLSPLFSSDLNQRQVARGLLMQLVAYRDQSYFERIKVLPERCNLRFRNGQVSVTEYWDIDPSVRFRGTFEDKKRRFAELFRDSVRLHMRSDVALGGCLSGGLDSSSIASVISRDHASVPFKTFTIYYTGKGQMDEREWVNEVIRTYPGIDPVFCSPSHEEVASSFDCVVRAHDVPVPRSTALSYYFLMQAAAAERMKVMLDGQGADEYLAGYAPSYSRVIAGCLSRLGLVAAWKALNWRSSRRLGRRDTARTTLRALLRGEQKVYEAYYRPGLAALGIDGMLEFELSRFDGSPLKRYLYHALLTTSLPTMLHYQDRVAMLFSIENRVPFLDHRLVEFVYSLDDDDLVCLGRTKHILRASLSGFLPTAIAHRVDKQAFAGVDTAVWLHGPLKSLLEKPLDFERLTVLNPQRTSELIAQFKSGDRSQARLVWRLAALQRWMEIQ